MSQAVINQSNDNAYTLLRAVLEKHGCRVASESPQNLVAYQGSLWGLSPRTAKKTIRFTLEPQESKTVVSYRSSLASDWRNITLFGCVVAVVLVGVCVWMALDLTQFMADGNPSFWSWIITANGIVRFETGEAFVNLAWSLAVFLVVIIALEAAVYRNCSRNIDDYARQVVDEAASR